MALHVIVSLLAACIMAADSLVTEPAPIIVDASEFWEGNDGPWSTFFAQVGNPPQVVRVLVSTAASASWVVLEEGCPTSGLPACNSSRGGLFEPENSTTWQNISIAELGIEDNLGYTDYNFGLYGLDTYRLGIPSGQYQNVSDVPRQLIAGMATKQWWLGSLGINPKQVNISTWNNTYPSMMSELKNGGSIPSLTYGYTAGAPYRLKKVLGSLILGGYDASRFEPSTTSFSLAPDDSRDLVVAIQTIVSESRSLLPEPILAYIDSTVPHIWLPADACKLFEQAFGLALDPATDLYLVTDAQHEALLSANSSVKFMLGNQLGAPDTSSVVIELPYAAFDLQVSYPYVNSSTRYFPLRVASNDTQYTLGRTFLQEAYLIVDYERRNFTVAPAAFVDGAQQEVVAIKSPTDQANAVHDGEKGKPRTIGIVVPLSVLVLGLLASIIAVRWARHRNRSNSTSMYAAVSSPYGTDHKGSPRSDQELEDTGMVELEGARASELSGIKGHLSHEMEVVERRHEICSPHMVHELAAGDVLGILRQMGREETAKEQSRIHVDER